MKNDLEERKRRANEEFQLLLKWANEESDKVTSRLKAEGTYIEGLDTNQKAYLPVQAEFKRKVLELFDKYDLPNKPNW